MGRAFPPRADCPQVPTDEEIVIDPFTFDWDIVPVITEFPMFDFVPPEPPSFDYGCYKPAVSSAFSPSGTAKFNASVSFPKSGETGNCEPQFDFDVCIPCPVMEVKEAKLQTGIPALSITFQKPGDPCEWDFEFDLTVPPCATINVGTVSIAEGPAPSIDMAQFTKTSEENCTTEFDLSFKVPPCVTNTIGTASINPAPTPSIDFSTTKLAGNCNWRFDLEIEVPPCVTNRINTATIAVAATPSVTFTTTKEAGDCNWKFDLDIKVPPGICVDLTPVGTIEQVEGLPEPTIDFEATKTSGPDGCAWRLDLDIKIPTGGGGGGGAGSVCRARAATTEEIGTYGLKTVDGVALSEDDVVLVKDQNDKKENGTFKVKEDGEWERTCTIGPGTMVSVREGAVNGQTEWMQMTDGEIVVGTTDLLFLKEKDCCCIAKAATVEQITLNGEQTIDHVGLVDGDICLVKDQDDPTENGVYLVVDGDEWVRTCPLEAGCTVSVNEGWTNGNSIWMLKASEVPIEAGETELSYALMTTGTVNVRVATIKQEGSLSGEITIDGVPLLEGDLCLVRVQDNLASNGIYRVVEGDDWERVGPIFHNQLVNVREGVVTAHSTYQLIPVSPDPIIVGTTELPYMEILHCITAKAATVGVNISLSGTAAVDGVPLAEGDVILVKDQTDKTENGVYAVNATSDWKRIGGLVSGQKVTVLQGQRNGSMDFFLSNSPPIIPDTTQLYYMSISPELGVYFAHHATFSPGLFPSISLSGNQTIDGYTTSPGEIVLIRDRAHGTGINGLYVTSAGAWTKIVPRPAPFIARSFYLIFVAYGNVHFDSCFISFSNFETTRGLGSYFRLSN